MKILDFRKYFFANISALWFYIFIFLVVNYTKMNYPIPCPNDALSLGAVDLALMLIVLLILICCIFITIFEICIRKYIIERKFPNFKLNIKIKIPKTIVIIYNIIFSIGFTLACILFITGLVIVILTIFGLIFS